MKIILAILFSGLSLVVMAQYSDDYQSLELRSLAERTSILGHGDLDGDGNSDYLIAASDHIVGGSMSWVKYFEGRPLPMPQFLIESEEVLKALITDVDGDGDNDILYQSSDGQGTVIRWHENVTGRATVWKDHRSALPTAINNNRDYAHFGDLNDDGLADVVYSSEGTVFCSLNQQGRFAAPVSLFAYQPRYNVQDLYLGDANGDGFKDVIHAYRSEEENNYSFEYRYFSFAPSGARPAPAAPPPTPLFSLSGLASKFMDVNDDGRADPLWYRHDANYVAVYLNLPGGAQLLELENVTGEVFTYDLDRDGTEDVIYRDDYGNVNFRRASRGAGGAWSLAEPQTLAGDRRSVREEMITDEFLDGHLEILGVQRFPRYGVIPSRTRVSLEATDILTSEPLIYPLDLTTARPDRYPAGNYASYFVGTQLGQPPGIYRVFPVDGTSTTEYAAEPIWTLPDTMAEDYRSSNQDINMIFADLNRDGMVDGIFHAELYYPYRSQTYLVLSSRKERNYRLVKTNGYGAEEGEMRLVDFADRHSTILVHDKWEENCPLRLWINRDGDGQPDTVQCLDIFGTDIHKSYVRQAAADVDNDGAEDLLLQPYQGVVYYARYDPGKQIYEEAVPLAQATFNSRRVVSGDFNGDGLNDLAGIGLGPTWIAIAQTGKEHRYITRTLEFTDHPDETAFLAVDWDNDGKQEMLMAGPAAARLVELTDQNSIREVERLENPNPTGLNTPFERPYVQVVDVDGDGDEDILFHDRVLFYYPNLSNEASVTVGTYFDENGNGLQDDSEGFLRNFQHNFDRPVSARIRQPDGREVFYLRGKVGGVIRPDSRDDWQITPDTLQVKPGAGLKGLTTLFGAVPTSITVGYTVTVSEARMRCGEEVPVWVTVTNDGSKTGQAGFFRLRADENLEILSPPDSTDGSEGYYRVPALAPTEEYRRQIMVRPPGAEALPYYLDLAAIYEYPVGNLLLDARDSTISELRCSYDPNDKAVTPQGVGRPGYVYPEEREFTYTIRFQNTGNDTAYLVVLRDTLDMDLDFSTLKPVASSHSVVTQLEYETGALSFILDNVNLVDSTTNPAGSQGFVTYRIALKPDRGNGTRITNRASIYFDFNPPIVTNETVNTLVVKIPTTGTATTHRDELRVLVSPNPATDLLRLELTGRNWENGEKSFTITDIGGRTLQRGSFSGQLASVSVKSLPAGIYLLYVRQGAQLGGAVRFMKVMR